MAANERVSGHVDADVLRVAVLLVEFAQRVELIDVPKEREFYELIGYVVNHLVAHRSDQRWLAARLNDACDLAKATAFLAGTQVTVRSDLGKVW